MRHELSPALVERLLRRLEELAAAFEKASVAEFLELYRRPARLLYLNFLSGILRGLGIGIGFTVVSALVLVLLTRLATLNLPIVGEWIAQIARIVQRELAAP